MQDRPQVIFTISKQQTARVQTIEFKKLDNLPLSPINNITGNGKFIRITSINQSIKSYLLRINIPSPNTYIKDHMRFNPGIFHILHKVNSEGKLHFLSKFGINKLLL